MCLTIPRVARKSQMDEGTQPSWQIDSCMEVRVASAPPSLFRALMQSLIQAYDKQSSMDQNLLLILLSFAKCLTQFTAFWFLQSQCRLDYISHQLNRFICKQETKCGKYMAHQAYSLWLFLFTSVQMSRWLHSVFFKKKIEIGSMFDTLILIQGSGRGLRQSLVQIQQNFII